MARSKYVWSLAFLVMCVSLSDTRAASDQSFSVVQFSENRTVKVEFASSKQIPDARIRAEVKFQEGQFRIELKFERMKPAVLFGGDVTCFVLWAINRDGAPENLGELWVRPDSPSDTVQFSTGLRNFALVISAEKYYQVTRPSELILFWNDNRPDPPVRTEPLIYSQFNAAPNRVLDSLESVSFDGKKPLDLLQAEKVLSFADELGAQELAADLYSQASLALRQATQMYERSRGKGAQRFARDSVAAANEAIRLSKRKLELQALEQEFTERQAQIAGLEGRAAQAEEQVRVAEATILKVEQQRAEAQRTVEETQAAIKELDAERAGLANEKAALEESLSSLRAERAALMREKRSLQEEKVDLQGRLQQALSMVADTKSSARGMIVNLPDILFAVGEAQLKPETEVVLAKLAGILLIMNDLNLRVEGHTDSTGSPSFNLRLSQRRADSVFDFLARQGIEAGRMMTVGYGMDRPIAENTTVAGRSQNRRVEIVIAEGEVAAE